MIGSPVDTFKGISPAEFFYRNKQMAGFGNATQALYTTVRELVENSLDSCEDAGVFPYIKVELNQLKSDAVEVKVSDNGAGIPHEVVPDAFGKVLFGSKYSSRQRRGTFGLGVTMSVLYGQITTDSPAIVHTKTDSKEGKQYRVFVDVETNTPLLEQEKTLHRKETGTEVSIILNGDLKRARDRIIEYIELSGISTPYARFELRIENELQLSVGPFVNNLPPLPTIAKPHPHAADVELLRRLASTNPHAKLQDFLIDSFQQVGVRTASRFLKFSNLDSSMQISSLSRENLVYLSRSLQKYADFDRPSSDSLSPIGKEQFLKSVGSHYQTTSISYSNRGPLEWDGIPYIIEGVLALSEKFPARDVPHLFRFANRVPLLYNNSDDVFAKVLKRISWSRYGVDEKSSVSLFVHFCSTRVPYSAAGKQSLASVGSIEDEILALYRELGRRLSKMTQKRGQTGRYQKKRREFTSTFKLLAKFSSDLAGTSEVPETDSMIERLFEGDMDA
ncbi:MAG: DNA topoisomerase VI subunit B [Candidatus Thorarchaeota archaeon]|nr:DNA topoisomerase VI subunit B [Candidatus Thorarchaeota archaeon]